MYVSDGKKLCIFGKNINSTTDSPYAEIKKSAERRFCVSGTDWISQWLLKLSAGVK